MSHSLPMTNDDDAEIQRYKNSKRMSSIPVRLSGSILNRNSFQGSSINTVRGVVYMSEKNNIDLFPEDFEVKYKNVDDNTGHRDEPEMVDEISDAINAKLEEYQQVEFALEESQEDEPVELLLDDKEMIPDEKPRQVQSSQKTDSQINQQQRDQQQRRDQNGSPTISSQNAAKTGPSKKPNVNRGRNNEKGSTQVSSNRKHRASSVDPRTGPQVRSKHVPRPRKAKKKSKTKRKFITFLTVLLILAVAYCGVAFYFSTHFMFNTQINGVNVSNLTPEDVRGHINNTILDYTLTIVKRDGETEIIRGEEIGLAYYDTGEIQGLLDDQNIFAWPLSLVFSNSLETPIGVTFDPLALDRAIENTRAVSTEQVAPVSAWPVFNGVYYEIEPEVIGSTIDVGRMKSLIHDAVYNFLSEINLEHEELYELPRFTSESHEVISARDTMNTFLDATITYTLYEDVIIDSLTIIDWISLSDELIPILHEDRVAAWVASFADTYDTVGTTRYLTTPTGREVSVSGGFYGWQMDREAETAALINNIRQGQVVTREPIYSQRAAVHEANDWGDTFIQVDLAYQMMWFFEDGVLMLESPVVTGLPGSMATPPGVFFIVEMLRDTILEGAVNPDTGVEATPTPVEYWMRVTWEGIGFHDAIWQESFGGDRYQTYGSHGCINMPLELARELFHLIDIYIPVIIHQ